MTDTTLPKTLQEAGVATETSSLPDHYSQLDAAEKAAWDMLEDGAASAKTAFHTPVLATVAPDGAPLARTVVLREASRAEKILRANTDQRSRKARDLAGVRCDDLNRLEPGAPGRQRLAAKQAQAQEPGRGIEGG